LHSFFAQLQCRYINFALFKIQQRFLIPGGVWEFFSCQAGLDQLWGLPSLLSKGYRGDKAAGAWSCPLTSF